VQAIYLFGTHGTEYERPDSDVDIAVLLPHLEARQQPQLALTPCHTALSVALKKPVDLVNIRQVSTVFQNEIVNTGRRLSCVDEYAAGEFEMLTLSYYQELNEERKEILAAFRETGKAYNV
jgi:predicted nucleotidyltransferase